MHTLPVAMPAPVQAWVEPLAKINRFVVSQLEKGITLGMDSAKAYLDLGLTQVKVAAKVTDARSLQEFADSQFAVLSFVGHRLIDDRRAMNEWSISGWQHARYLARDHWLRLWLK